MPFREATDNVQALEARGDFKYKGIYGLYSFVLDSTARFLANRILPEVGQVKREVPLPDDRFNEFMMELSGRGSTRQPMILVIPSVDFVAGAGRLSQLIILCRPTQQDGTSGRRYVDFYRQKSVEALTAWLRFNESHWVDLDADALFRQISQGGIQNTHAGAIIARHFLVPYDKTTEHKAMTYRSFVRPIIQQLIDEKKLLYLKDTALNFHTIQFADEQSLKARIEMLSTVSASAIPGFQMPGEFDPNRVQEQAEQLYRNSSLSPIQKQIVAELRLVLGEYQRLIRSRKEREQKDRLSTASADLLKQDRVVPTTHFRNWDEDFISKLNSMPEVLTVEYPMRGRVFTFVLHRQKAYQAVISARKVFDEKADETEVRILLAMGVARFLEGDQLRAFEDLEERLLFERLPWFVRAWRALFGRRRISKEEIIAIRESMKKEELDEQVEIKRKDAERTTRKRAEEQLEKKRRDPSPDDNVVEANTIDATVAKSKETMAADERAEEVLRKIIDLLDAAWDRKELPNRTYVLENTPDFEGNEDMMVNFLKKYGRKQIYSFRVMREDPKFLWPILISKRYIVRNGRKMLREAIEETDRQRKALMPEQEKFDVSTAIEDFLTRLMTKRQN